MTSDYLLGPVSYWVDDKGRLNIKSDYSEVTRRFFRKHGELDVLEGAVDKNLDKLQAKQSSEVWNFLFRIKSTIHYIRKHHRQGDDVHALVFDLGRQVAEANKLELLIDVQLVKGRKLGASRGAKVGKSGYTLDHLKAVAEKKYYSALNRVESFGKKETAYLEAKQAVYKECNEIRSLATIKRWILEK